MFKYCLLEKENLCLFFTLKCMYFINFFRSCKGVTFLCHVTEVECFLNGDSERIALDHQWCIKNSEIDRREKGLSQNLGRRIVGLLKLVFKVLIGLPLAIFGLI